MNRDTCIKLKKKINVTDLSGEKVMVDFDTGKYYLIKGTGNDIWDIIQDEVTIGGIIDSLLAEYDVSEAECEKSVIDFLSKILELEMIEIS